MVEATGTESVYGVMASWMTPSCLFIFINLIIGTIAITSRFATPRRQQHRDSPPQLARCPSLFDRVLSFKLGYYKPPTLEETELAVDSVQNRPDSPQLARDQSLLDRVRSFRLGLHKTEEKQEAPCPNPDDPTRVELTRAPSLLERIKSMKFYRSESTKSEKNEPGPGSGSKPDIDGNESGHGEEEGVDKKADNFINNFKQQLRMQRLDSIMRYRDMLKGN